jgi:hypothetical protein
MYQNSKLTVYQRSQPTRIHAQPWPQLQIVKLPLDLLQHQLASKSHLSMHIPGLQHHKTPLHDHPISTRTFLTTGQSSYSGADYVATGRNGRLGFRMASSASETPKSRIGWVSSYPLFSDSEDGQFWSCLRANLAATRMVSICSLLIPFCLSIHSVHALTNYQADADIDYGNFQDPSSRVRPRFRYWLPDASVDSGTVRDNIRSAGAIGAGGVEFLPFYNYGSASPPGCDWFTYGFGTPIFDSMFRVALEAHQESGLIMDFALGPNQGQGAPAYADDEGVQWDLVCPLFASMFYYYL